MNIETTHVARDDIQKLAQERAALFTLVCTGCVWGNITSSNPPVEAHYFTMYLQYHRPGVDTFMVSLSLSEPKRSILSANSLDNNVRVIAVYQSAFFSKFIQFLSAAQG